MTTIAFIGAGSVVFTKNLLGDLLSDSALDPLAIHLHDIDPRRLETAEQVARTIARQCNPPTAVQSSLDRRRALDGADYVINTIQVGGYAATRVDFDVPRKYGVRQTIADTHSIGGIFRALRTIPVLLDIARDMQECCPHALFINYTNPLAALCRAVFEATPLRIIGLCHSMRNTTKQMAQYAGVPYKDVTFLGAGINHLAWILRFEYQGQDAYPLLRRAIAEKRIPKDDLVRAELCTRLGYFVTESSEHVSEYLPYFLPHPELIEQLNIPLDDYIRRSEEHLVEFEEMRVQVQRDEPIPLKPSEEYAPELIHALETYEPCTIYGSVRNLDLIDNLPWGACVEVPIRVDGNGIQPECVGTLPTHLAALDATHLAIQELVVRAALEQRREDVYHAAMLDPLLGATLTLDEIWMLVDEMFAAHSGLLPHYT
ncbi:MAG TPA: alpha-glucosidase/alpha-galactosidase [Anaerolineae bacterium]|nr:alpha-glucosidase/alpha-galactosidase [Anaerolineae bacterium]